MLPISSLLAWKHVTTRLSFARISSTRCRDVNTICAHLLEPSRPLGPAKSEGKTRKQDPQHISTEGLRFVTIPVVAGLRSKFHTGRNRCAVFSLFLSCSGAHPKKKKTTKTKKEDNQRRTDSNSSQEIIGISRLAQSSPGQERPSTQRPRCAAKLQNYELA